MTDQDRLNERATAFERAYALLKQQFGFEFAARIEVEQWGPKVECRPALVVRPIENWIPSEPPNTESSDGTPLMTDQEIKKALRN